MPNIGAGICPAGTSRAGFGVPAQGPASGGAVFQDPLTGAQLGARLIDPKTRQPVFDANGRTVGQENVPHLMQMALSTESGSSAMLALGQKLASIKRITQNFARLVRDEVARAAAHLTSQNLVEILSVDVTRVGTSAARAHVRWRDLTTNQEHTEHIG